MTRAEQIAANLTAVRARIADAARAAGRLPESVRLLAVSKKMPADDVRAALAAGQRAFGENYAQELRDKSALLAAEPAPPEWHFIGPLQSNKVKYVAGRVHASLPGTVDSDDVVQAGMFGLFDAITKFEPTRGLKFETYAVNRIRGAIIDDLRDQDWVPRSVRTKIRAVDQAVTALEIANGRTPTEAEIAGWSALPPGSEELGGQGARPADATAAEEFFLRTTAEPSVSVNGIESGSPHLQKTVLPIEAHANVSIRLAPGQSTAEIAPVFERLLREAAPAGTTLDVVLRSSGEPAYVDPGTTAVQLGLDAFEHVLGTRPILTRSGGSIPVAATLAARGVPAIVTGFSRPTAQMHSPNENFPAPALAEGLGTIVELLRRFGTLG